MPWYPAIFADAAYDWLMKTETASILIALAIAVVLVLAVLFL